MSLLIPCTELPLYPANCLPADHLGLVMVCTRGANSLACMHNSADKIFMGLVFLLTLHPSDLCAVMCSTFFTSSGHCVYPILSIWMNWCAHAFQTVLQMLG